jgi:hypothetical protein
MTTLEASQSLQAIMKATLERAGIPFLDLDCYGSQIVVTVKGYETAHKWAALLAQFCKTVRGPKESWEQKKEDAGKSRPRHFKVWRVWGTV